MKLQRLAPLYILALLAAVCAAALLIIVDFREADSGAPSVTECDTRARAVGQSGDRLLVCDTPLGSLEVRTSDGWQPCRDADDAVPSECWYREAGGSSALICATPGPTERIQLFTNKEDDVEKDEWQQSKCPMDR